MSRDIVDLVLLEVGLPQEFGGNIELQEVESFEVSETDPGAEVVKTIRRSRRAIGHKSGVPDFEVTLEVMKVNPPEVDWLGLKQAEIEFDIYYEENDGGQRYQLRDCKVIEVGKSANADGEVTESVSILALDHVREEF